jgi:hypothetical protein
MTIGTVVLLALGQRPTAVVRQLLTGFARHRPTIRIRDILGTVFLTTIVVELIGASLLFVAFTRTTQHQTLPGLRYSIVSPPSAMQDLPYGRTRSRVTLVTR